MLGLAANIMACGQHAYLLRNRHTNEASRHFRPLSCGLIGVISTAVLHNKHRRVTSVPQRRSAVTEAWQIFLMTNEQYEPHER
jgi:hypothetical protein